MNKITLRTKSVAKHENLVLLLTYFADPASPFTSAAAAQLVEELRGAHVTHHRDGRRGKKPSRTPGQRSGVSR